MQFLNFLNLVPLTRFIQTGAMSFTRKTVNRWTITRKNDTEETLNDALDIHNETIAQMSPIKKLVLKSKQQIKSTNHKSESCFNKCYYDQCHGTSLLNLPVQPCRCC